MDPAFAQALKHDPDLAEAILDRVLERGVISIYAAVLPHQAPEA